MNKLATLFILGAVLVGGSIPLETFAQGVAIPSGSPTRRPCMYIESNVGYGAQDRMTNGNVINVQIFLKLYGYFNVEPTGYFGPITLSAAKNFQRDNGIPQTGFFGPLSRAQMKLLSCADDMPTPAPDTKGVTVSISADKKIFSPTETVNFTVTAKNTTKDSKTITFNNGCQTSYIIGEYNSLAAQLCTMALGSLTLKANESKTWNMSHDLSMTPIPGGVQNLVGTVAGVGSATTTITISGTTTPAPSVTVTKPKVGDTVLLGQKYMIEWNAQLGATNPVALVKDSYIIELAPSIRCITTPCPQFINPVYIIAKDVPTTTYSWTVGKTTNGGETLLPGNYSIRICNTAKKICSEGTEVMLKS
ncbi:peptidoglycan-binding protein [Patescibacteria group bacterium]|nr:peptidoglycan-binding protein [Patescibacteria group bacterium]